MYVLMIVLAMVALIRIMTITSLPARIIATTHRRLYASVAKRPACVYCN